MSMDGISSTPMQNTVEQEIFATGNFRDSRLQTIRVQEIFANFQIAEVLGNIRVQEIFANVAIFAKFAKISCTRKIAVLQYNDNSDFIENYNGNGKD